MAQETQIKPHVTSWCLAGSCYKRGFYMPGFGTYTLSTGETKYVPEKEACGIQAILNAARKSGFDTFDAQEKLNRWVEKGGDLVKFELRP